MPAAVEPNRKMALICLLLSLVALGLGCGGAQGRREDDPHRPFSHGGLGAGGKEALTLKCAKCCGMESAGFGVASWSVGHMASQHR